MRLGSLFDGSGGFPLAGTLCGITPIFASEIEPYPVAVTTSRFPQMLHLGDISKINGAEIPPVDVITFGSPCQDLSVAGLRKGLKHQANGDDETTRSGLFMEAVRIIKEMRRATNGKYPRYAVWENVMGAFSSNAGEDFRVVLEELIKIAEPEAPPLPPPGKAGWPYADCIMGDGWSLAWRTFDAQYWGVAQRRRRLYALIDLAGDSAPKVLFERPGLRGYFEKGRAPWKDLAAEAEKRAGADDRERASAYCVDQGGGKSAANVYEEKAPTLTCTHAGEPAVCYAVATQQGGAEITEDGICPTVTAAAGTSGNNQPWICAYGISSYDSNAMKSENPRSGIYEAKTSRTLDLNGGNPACNQGGIAVVQPTFIIDQIGGQGEYYQESRVSSTLRAGGLGAICHSAVYKADDGSTGDAAPCLVGDHNNRVTDHTALVLETFHCQCEEEKSTTLKARDYKDPSVVCYGLDPRAAACLASGKEVAGCLMASGYDKLGAQEMFSGDYTVIEEHIVRRLTPIECARLQGFPDAWGYP